MECRCHRKQCVALDLKIIAKTLWSPESSQRSSILGCIQGRLRLHVVCEIWTTREPFSTMVTDDLYAELQANHRVRPLHHMYHVVESDSNDLVLYVGKNTHTASQNEG